MPEAATDVSCRDVVAAFLDSCRDTGEMQLDRVEADIPDTYFLAGIKRLFQTPRDRLATRRGFEAVVPLIPDRGIKSTQA